MPDLDADQADLFGGGQALPQGFAYRPDLLSADEERALAGQIAATDLRPFEFQGFLGRRRVASFGWRYRFDGTGLEQAEPLPAFLEPLHNRRGPVGLGTQHPSRRGAALLDHLPHPEMKKPAPVIPERALQAPLG